MNSNQPLTSRPDTVAWAGPFVLEGGKLDRVLTPSGYIKADTAYYFLRDHQGSVRQVVSGADGSVVQENQYYPYGSLHGESSAQALANGASAQPYKYGGKERLSAAGLNLYDFGPRALYSPTAQFTSMDPKCEDYPHLSPYLYCAANPINLVDPTGESTYVVDKGNGIYEVVGGDINDGDLNIYAGNWNEDHTEFVKTRSIGVTTSITSFYDSDDNGGKWKDGAKINVNDHSGEVFLDDIMNNTPLLLDYAANARHDKKYDFKKTNGVSGFITDDIYRGMPVGKTDNGQTIYSSARDIGNIAAGYVAAVNGISWAEARIAFDAYQGGKEGISSTNAQLYGWQMGETTTTSKQKRNNAKRSFIGALKKCYKNVKIF